MPSSTASLIPDSRFWSRSDLMITMIKKQRGWKKKLRLILLALDRMVVVIEKLSFLWFSPSLSFFFCSSITAKLSCRRFLGSMRNSQPATEWNRDQDFERRGWIRMDTLVSRHTHHQANCTVQKQKQDWQSYSLSERKRKSVRRMIGEKIIPGRWYDFQGND